MTTEARKIRQAYDDGKAFMKPEIEALKKRVAELERQLEETKAKEQS